MASPASAAWLVHAAPALPMSADPTRPVSAVPPASASRPATASASALTDRSAIGDHPLIAGHPATAGRTTVVRLVRDLRLAQPSAAAALLARIPESAHPVPPPAGSRPALHRPTEPSGIPEQPPEAAA